MDELEMQSNEVAEDVGAAATEEPAGDQGEHEQDQEHAERKYTDADVDRIIAKKIAAERSRMQKLFNEEQQESEIEKRERDVLKKELRMNAREALLNDDLPASLIEVMNFQDEESYNESYKHVTIAFREAMHQEYVRKFGGPAPRVGTGSGSDPIHNVFAPKAR